MLHHVMSCPGEWFVFSRTIVNAMHSWELFSLQETVTVTSRMDIRLFYFSALQDCTVGILRLCNFKRGKHILYCGH